MSSWEHDRSVYIWWLHILPAKAYVLPLGCTPCTPFALKTTSLKGISDLYVDVVRNPTYSIDWVAAEELNLNQHIIDTWQIIWYLNYGH